LDLKGDAVPKIEMKVPNVNRGDLAETMVVEEEIRNFVRRPICRPCAKGKGERYYLQPAQMTLVQGNEEQGLQMWTCPKCEYSARLPKGLFPQASFKIVNLYGPQDEATEADEQ
jgi:hypothetical protein